MAAKVALWKKVICTPRQGKTSTDHKTDEKLEGAKFLACDKTRTKPEDERNNEKHNSLGERVQQTAPDSSVHRMLQWKFQATTVHLEAVLFSSERGNCPNSAGSFTSHLGRFFVGLLVFLIFQNNNLLKRHKYGGAFSLERRVTYKADIPSGENQRSASNGNKTQLPCKYKPKDGTRDNGSNGLTDSTGTNS